MSHDMNNISVSEARRGIYLDFEGFMNAPPALAGVLIEGKFRQVVLEPSLQSAADAKDLAVESLDDFIKGLLLECDRNHRSIIAFSTYELTVVQRECLLDISGHYKNALKLAKKWKRQRFPEIDLKRKSLDQFLLLPGVGYPVPAHLGKGNATKRLRAVMTGLASRRSYDALTGTKKAQWTKLLDYNRHDVCGLHALTLRAALDLQA